MTNISVNYFCCNKIHIKDMKINTITVSCRYFYKPFSFQKKLSESMCGVKKHNAEVIIAEYNI